MDNRLTKIVALLAVLVALLLGIVIGVGGGLADRIFGGAKPEVIANSALQ